MRRHPNLLNVMAVTMVIAALSFVVHYWKYRCGRRGNLLYRNGTTIPVSGRFPKIYQAKHNRNQTPNPRAPLTSNRSGRSSDSLLFRSLPGPCGPVAEMFETSRSFTAAGLSGIHTRFPFHSSPCIRSRKPNLPQI